jgi:hypothetical protein
MKRLIPLALVAFALSAVPVALADDGGSTPPATGQAPAAQQQQQQQSGATPRLRFRMILMRFARHCDANATTDVQQRCAAFLQRLEARVQAKCSSADADKRCARVEALIQKLQDRLNGGQAPSSDAGQSALDQAAAGLGSLKP